MDTDSVQRLLESASADELKMIELKPRPLLPSAWTIWVFSLTVVSMRCKAHSLFAQARKNVD